MDVGGGNPVMDKRFIINFVCGSQNKAFCVFLKAVDVGDGNPVMDKIFVDNSVCGIRNKAF